MSKRYFLPIFLVFQIIFLQILKHFPEFIEKFYSNGLYIYISRISRILFGKIPFSVGDCIYGILILLILRWFWKVRDNWKANYKDNILKILSVLSVFYFLFHILWGFNYYREPLFEKMNIKREYSDADLVNFTKKLISKANETQFEIAKNDSVKIVFPYSKEEAFVINLNGYENLSREHNYFKFSTLSIKNSLYSLPLTYMGFGGYLNPFTNEAQLNSLLPRYNFPSTSCHEMAHQLGYASESECNFIGFLATIKNDNLYYKYSGYCMALQYCLNNLGAKNPETAKALLKTIHKGILKNYKENDEIYLKYHSFIDDGFEIFYDQFLKSNNQKEGINSYNKFVDLAINYFKNKEL